MRPFPPKRTVLLLLATWLCAATSCGVTSRFGKWNVRSLTNAAPQGSWNRFIWAGDTLGGRYEARAVMLVPTRLEGLPYPFLFQFDLGADLTVLYSHPLEGLVAKHPEFYRVERLKSPLVFWNATTAFKNVTLLFDHTTATTKNCYVRGNFGERIQTGALADSIPISMGTIGADLFQDKILVIDYPNQRFAVCDQLPSSLQVAYSPLELDRYGRPLIALQVGGRTYRTLFDNGSSIFPLMVPARSMASFSGEAATDTLSISSWGTRHTVIGRPLKEPFRLGGQAFTGTTIYADYRPAAQTAPYDALAGNALFWDKTVVLDFKHKRFAVL